MLVRFQFQRLIQEIVQFRLLNNNYFKGDKMTIKTFWWYRNRKKIDEVREVLRKRYGDDVNEFWIT